MSADTTSPPLDFSKNKPAAVPSLFVGGPLDGRLMYWDQPEFHATDWKHSIDPDMANVLVRVYRLTRWQSGRCRWRIYVHDSLKDEDATAFILKGYAISRGAPADELKLKPYMTN